MLAISQRNFMMKEMVSGKVLSNTKVYMTYQVAEAVLIIAITLIQISFISRLLKGGSIV